MEMNPLDPAAPHPKAKASIAILEAPSPPKKRLLLYLCARLTKGRGCVGGNELVKTFGAFNQYAPPKKNVFQTLSFCHLPQRTRLSKGIWGSVLRVCKANQPGKCLYCLASGQVTIPNGRAGNVPCLKPCCQSVQAILI